MIRQAIDELRMRATILPRTALRSSFVFVLCTSRGQVPNRQDRAGDGGQHPEDVLATVFVVKSLATGIADRVDAPVMTQGLTSRYIPALDGLRAVSIMLVMLSHAGFNRVVPGGLGVTIFFVISGYLITGQMIGEVAATGRLDLRAFYLRRVFRLAPALLVYGLIFVPICAMLGAATTLPQIAAALFYVANYWELYFGFSTPSPFPILWSLSVEEHYYLLFPLLVAALIPDLRRLAVPILAVGLAALLWRFHLERACQGGAPWLLCGLPQAPGQSESLRIYHGTDTRFDSILAGALLAWVAAYGPGRWRAVLIGRPAMLAGLAAILLTLLIRNEFFRDTIRYTIQELAIAVVLGNVVLGSRTRLASVLAFPVMTYVGRLSYSLYLYHFGSLMVIVSLLGRFSWRDYRFALFFVISFALAMASHHLVEKPMIRLRRRFGSRTTRQTA